MMETRTAHNENDKTKFDPQVFKALIITELKTIIDYRAKQPQQDTLKDNSAFLSYVLGPTLLKKYHANAKNILQVANIRAITEATKKMLSDRDGTLRKIINLLKSPSLSEFDYIQIHTLLGLALSQKYCLAKLIENTTGVNPGNQHILDETTIRSLRDLAFLQLASAYEAFKSMVIVIENEISHNLCLNWEALRGFIYGQLSELDGLIEGDVIESVFTEKCRVFLNFVTKDLVKTQLINNGKMILNVDNIASTLLQFEKLYPVINAHLNYLRTRKKRVSRYNLCKLEIDKKLMQLQAQFLNVKNMVKKIKPLKDALDDEYRELQSIMAHLWPSEIPENLAEDSNTEQTIDFMLDKSLKNLDEFLTKLNETEQKLVASQEKQLQTMIIAEENKLLAASHEARLFKQDQMQKQQQFEDEVAAKRKEKLLPEPLSSQNQTSQTASVQKESQLTTYLNTDFVINFRKLKRSKKELLKKVLNQEDGLRYTKILSLFIKLGGTIEEIGNGSSHKRLKLPQVEMTLTSDLNAPNEAPVVTGGLFRPGDPMIPQAGLELINDLFSKAGITLTLIELLESEDIAVNNNNASKAEVSDAETRQNSRRF